MHWRGIEPQSPAWQARILPLNQRCLWIQISRSACQLNTACNFVPQQNWIELQLLRSLWRLWSLVRSIWCTLLHFSHILIIVGHRCDSMRNADNELTKTNSTKFCIIFICPLSNKCDLARSFLNSLSPMILAQWELNREPGLRQCSLTWKLRVFPRDQQ